MHLTSIISLGLCSMAAAVTNQAVAVLPLTVGQTPTTYRITFTAEAAHTNGNQIILTSVATAAGGAVQNPFVNLVGTAANRPSITAAGVTTCAESLLTTTLNTVATITLNPAGACAIAVGNVVTVTIPGAFLAVNPLTAVAPNPAAAVTVALRITTTEAAETGGNVEYTTGLQVAAASVVPSTTLAGAAVTKLDVGVTPTTALAAADKITVNTAVTSLLLEQAAVTVAVSDAKCTASGATTTAGTPATRTLTITLANAAGAVCAVSAATTFSVTNGLGTNPATGNVAFDIATTKDTSARTVQYAVTSGTVGHHVFSSLAVAMALFMSMMHTLA